MADSATLFQSLVRHAEQGRHAAFCVVVDTRGSAPQVPGAAMLLHADGTTEGTLGGGCVEAEVRKQAFELLQRNAAGLLTFDLDRDYGWDDGLICGGHMQVAVLPIRTSEEARPFAEAAGQLEQGEAACVPLRIEHEGRTLNYRLHIEAPARLIIAGAGHVGRAAAHLGRLLDFEVVVIDDRPEFANPERFPEAGRIIVADVARTLRALPVGPDTYIVIVTRGHRHDEDALRACVRRKAAYIGMIGSARKVGLLRDRFVNNRWCSPAEWARVRTPIGLPIGSKTVEEIAVSIAAELVSVRSCNSRAYGTGSSALRSSNGRAFGTGSSALRSARRKAEGGA